jgi:acetyl-CoA acetyltransferase family protein
MNPVSIPYRAYWSTPFAKWQGSLAHLHSIHFAAHVARHALAKRGIDPAVFDYGVLGLTVPQPACFYGLPWLMTQLGAPQVGGPTINQACATGARTLAACCAEIDAGGSSVALAISGDRVSNGPQLYYPNPGGPGGAGTHESWVLDNFARDPATMQAMVQTAENVAARFAISREEQDEVTLQRHAQYGDALADDRAFQRRYMDLPFDVPDDRLRRTQSVLDGDEGIHATTAAGLARLKPVTPGGTVTYGGQTHPADGSAAIVLTSADRQAELSADPAVTIRILGFGQARAEPAYMPAAPIDAARRVLAATGLSIGQIDAIKSHNPFVVNDIAFCRAFGIETARLNNYGCSLVWGHPQGPTGLRVIIELIEELVLRGGGIGLFHGCAAGDTAMAAIIEVR